MISLSLSLSLAIDPQFAENITVYHVNQASFGAAPVNMNTGNALGDMYFDFRSVDLPLECAHPSPQTAHDCENAEVTGNDLVITKLILEVDSSKYGSYGRCNVCVNGSDHHGDNNCTDGTYDCDCSVSFGQRTPCNASIGRSNITERYATRKCEGDIDCWKLNVAKKTGGFWYSTTEEGWCRKGTDGNCTWRVAEAVKRVNKTCSDDKIYTVVEKGDTSGCFANCKSGTGPARNISDACWIKCFYGSVLGPEAANPNATITGIPISSLVEGWDAPFASEQAGGCPSLPIPPGAEYVAVV